MNDNQMNDKKMDENQMNEKNFADWKKKIILFLTSQTLSLFGSSLVQYAISWYITLKTQSGVMMTISIICGFLPIFFLSPFAGVWADRYNRKTLIMLADAMIAVATLSIAIVFFLGYEAICSWRCQPSGRWAQPYKLLP